MKKMKKRLLCVFLSMVFIVSLCLPLTGCNNSADTDVGTPQASVAPPSTEAQVSDDGGGSAPSSGTSGNAYKQFGPDEPINFAYVSALMAIGWCVQVADAFNELADEYNLVVNIGDGELSPEVQFNLLEQYIAMGVDVVAVMLTDPGSSEAMAELCRNAGVLMVGETAAMMGADGKLVAPCDWLYGYEVGYKMGEWVAENHQRYGFDFSDHTNLGFAYISDATFVEMADRENGCKDAWFEAYPDFPKDQVFVGDVSAEGQIAAMEAGYNQMAAILTANPQIETWVVLSFQEDFASGACRAIEDLGLVDQVMLVSAGGENVIPEWDAGLTKPWYATCYFTGMDSARIVVEAIDKILRQGVAPEDVYPNKKPGETFGYQTFSGEMLDYDNYKTLLGR